MRPCREIPFTIEAAACSRIPKCSTRPYGLPFQASVEREVGMNDGEPSMVVLLDSARSAEPPQSSGRTGPMAFRTFPEAARVETSLPASNTGRAASMPTGSFLASTRSSRAAASGLADCHASNEVCQAARDSAPRSRTLRACARTSSSTSKDLAGSKPSTVFSAATSSAPRAEPWILPVFCFFGAG
ncbi:hypothetical protein D3C73_1197510 [compost metagenome]